MCNVPKAISDLGGGNTDFKGQTKKGDKISSGSERLYNTEADLAQKEFDLSQDEYNTYAKPALDEIQSESEITPQKIEEAQSRAGADVERQYASALDARQRDLARKGVNPSDPASLASTATGAVQLAGAKAGAYDTAGRNERLYRTQLAGSLAGRQAPTMTGAISGVNGAGSGLATLAGQQYGAAASGQANQSLAGIPGLSFSFKRGGPVRAAGGGIGIQRPGTVEDPPQYDQDAMPMVKRPDGSFASPEDSDANEGLLSGPGGPTGDKIKADVSDGEYINPAFVGKELGSPVMDTIVEATRQSSMGDPEAKRHVMKIISTVSSIGQKMLAPQRVAGKEPVVGPPGRGDTANPAVGSGPVMRKDTAAAHGGVAIRRVHADKGGFMDRFHVGAGQKQSTSPGLTRTMLSKDYGGLGGYDKWKKFINDPNSSMKDLFETPSTPSAPSDAIMDAEGQLGSDVISGTLPTGGAPVQYATDEGLFDEIGNALGGGEAAGEAEGAAGAGEGAAAAEGAGGAVDIAGGAAGEGGLGELAALFAMRGGAVHRQRLGIHRR